MPHKSFRLLSEPLMADPLRRARVEEMGRAGRVIEALAELRGMNRESGQDNEPGQSAIEAVRVAGDDSVFIAYLKEVIEDMGGRLEVTACSPTSVCSSWDDR
jgi:hypothetical protein